MNTSSSIAKTLKNNGNRSNLITHMYLPRSPSDDNGLIPDCRALILSLKRRVVRKFSKMQFTTSDEEEN